MLRYRMNRARPSILVKRGFNILELLITVSVLGIMAAVAVPRFAGQLQHHRLDMAAKRVMADFESVRSLAYNTSTPQTIRFSVAQSGYQIVGLVDPDRPNAPNYTVNLSESPYCCSLISANFSGNDAVTFNGHGLPNTNGTIELQLGNQLRRIVLDAGTGTVSVQ